MAFDLTTGTEILRRTPATIAGFVRDLPPDWVHADVGPWRAYLRVLK